MINHLEISNYKSIRKLELPCSRINVFIGEPNVGKSNILEALDLSYLSSMMLTNKNSQENNKEQIDLAKYFRVNTVSDLFADADIENSIRVQHDIYPGTSLSFNREEGQGKSNAKQNSFFEIFSGGSSTKFDKDFKPLEHEYFFMSPIVPFRFKENSAFHDINNYMNRLEAPFGNNLLEVIKYNPDFRLFIGGLIAEFGLEFNIDNLSQTLTIQKKVSPGIVYNMRYEALADTLRRIIFYIAAIRHGEGKVVTLEEPDTHSFPKFVSLLADEIIEKKDKQLFIATHNPYLLSSLIENTASNERSIFVCGFNKEKGTYVNKLTDTDLSELLDYGVDIFFNINRYLNDGVEHSA